MLTNKHSKLKEAPVLNLLSSGASPLHSSKSAKIIKKFAKFTPNKYFQFLQYTSYGNLHEHHRTTFLLILYPENIPV